MTDIAKVVENTGRYTVGKKLLVVCFFSNGEAPILGYGHPFMMGSDKYPSDIVIRELTVTEHHKVKWDYDKEEDEASYDGYLLKDTESNIYANQYPKASYGQTTDSGNRLFTRHCDSVEELTVMLGCNEPTMFYLLSDFYRNMTEGIVKLTDRQSEGEESEGLNKLIQNLKKLKADIDSRVKSEFKMEYKMTTELVGEARRAITHAVLWKYSKEHQTLIKAEDYL